MKAISLLKANATKNSKNKWFFNIKQFGIDFIKFGLILHRIIDGATV